MVTDVILNTNLEGIKFIKKGKVRDIYEIDNCYLIVATDRISAFDVVLPNGIPYKGIVLTQLSLFFFNYTKDIIDNHLISGDVDDFPKEIQRYKNILKGRAMLVKKAKPLPIECIVRGYITGSGWKDYKQTGKVCGITLREGLLESERLDEVIFTPSTKAETGHDINISKDDAKKHVPFDILNRIEDISKTIFNRCHDYMEEKGIILADTKFEFGTDEGGNLLLIDELLTPDSSRFWPADSYEPGRQQRSYDKQYVRDFLENSGWDKTPPPPTLPLDVVEKTSSKYKNIHKIITDKDIENIV